MREIKADLLAHLGGSASATQMALAERAAWLQLHISQLDATAASGAALTPEASRAYLSLSGSLARTLRQLGTYAAPPKVLSLADHVARQGKRLSA